MPMRVPAVLLAEVTSKDGMILALFPATISMLGIY